MDLGISDDELATCVACGLCLPHCPTYRVTGEEALSPRGRVAAMRQVQWDGAAPDASFVHSITTCVQCRGCETACPSGVPFGHLVEAARTSLAGTPPVGPEVDRARPGLVMRLGLRALGHHRLVLAGSSLLGVAQRLRLMPAAVSRRLGLPARVPVRQPRLRSTGSGAAGAATDVWLFTGCVMDAWMRDVHADVQRVVEAAGGRVALPGAAGACCGALAHHAGLAGDAHRRARRTIEAFPGEAPVLVDAAGCGAMLKDYGRLLGTPEAERFSARVLDVHEWLAPRVDMLTSAAGRGGGPAARLRVAVQDPCHLRHAQRAHLPVRTVLTPFADLVELDDEGLCCGAGGAYAAVQPVLASAIRDRKLAAISRSGAPIVTSANPGCALYLAAAGVETLHPCQIVARALPAPATDRQVTSTST
jgi:glycolate oxidase iron-sulfur subunit